MLKLAEKVNVYLARARRGYHWHFGGDGIGVHRLDSYWTICGDKINSLEEKLTTLPDPNLIQKLKRDEYQLCNSSIRILPQMVRALQHRIVLDENPEAKKAYIKRNNIVEELTEEEPAEEVERLKQILENLKQLQELYKNHIQTHD